MSNSSNAVPSAGVVTTAAPRVEWLLAPNAGAWTFQGTNTWIVGGRAGDSCAVIDPGPEDDEHARALHDAIAGRTVTHIVVTHGHGDHIGGADDLVARTGATITKATASPTRTTIHDGDRLMLSGDVEARILLTPGHTRDSLCLYLPDDRIVFTGDTLLGSGSPVVHPALLREMLASLRVLKNLGSTAVLRAFPGHGPAVPDLAAAATRRINARRRRIRQVEELAAEGNSTIEAMVVRMYPHITDPDVLKAARSSVHSMLTYLGDATELSENTR